MANAKFSQGMRDDMLNGTSVENAFNSGVLELRTGTQPTSANDAPVGTLLASIDLPADAFGAVTNGVISLAGVWQETAAPAAGVATWFRLKSSTDGGASSTSDVRIDGDVTATGGGGDIQITSTTIAVNDQVTVDTFTLTIPAG